MLGQVLTYSSWHHLTGLPGHIPPNRADTTLKLYPVAGFLRAHALLQNHLLLEVCVLDGFKYIVPWQGCWGASLTKK